MAAETAHAPAYVDGMVEVDIVGGLMDARPADRPSCHPAFPYGVQLRAGRTNLRVAGHAGLGCRDVRVGRNFDKAMAVPAIHPELAHVQGVRKWSRLQRFVADIGVFWREEVSDPHDDSDPEYEDPDRYLSRLRIGPFWENIGHGRKSSSSAKTAGISPRVPDRNLEATRAGDFTVK